MKKFVPVVLAALAALFLLCGCDGEQAQPIADGKTPVHQQASKKADEAGQ